MTTKSAIIKEELTFWGLFFAFSFGPSLLFLVCVEVPEELKIDAELINGLLTASSILFGISSLVLTLKFEKIQVIGSRFKTIMLFNLMLFVNFGFNIFSYAVENDPSGIVALHSGLWCLGANSFSAYNSIIRLNRL